MDQADLDFGIYRIMNAKRGEVETFLNEDLLPTVKTALAEFQPAGMASKREELDSAIKNAQALGMDPNAVPRIQELRAELENGVDIEKLEEQVYSDLYTFFARYYSDGDFMSLRRYKEGVYALPYEGEEVKLHWANADQYYIKSAENFQTYAFKVPVTIPAVPGATGTIIGKRVRFELVSATTEQNNNKAAADKERRFILHSADPIAVENGELIIRFEYRADEEKRKQKDLNALAVEAILGLTEGSPLTSDIEDWNIWLEALSANVGTDKNKDRTVLEKHLTDYTAKNSFDYFIHKDLGKFLKRELDFFIQNEVMVLDDLLPNDPDKLNAQIMVSQQMLSKAATLKKIALKVIEFLAQLEDFQKKLWLKKKFVLETNWLITLDRIDEELYEEIAANDAQREEWVKLFAIDEIGETSDEENDQGSMSFETTPAYSNPLTVEFLKANPSLVLDTVFFDQDFKDRLLAEVDDLDENTSGVLVHSENFQALMALQERYRGQLKSIYIDPPYNTNASEIVYKNGFKHSSWISLISDRLKSGMNLLSDTGQFCVAIDDFEYHRLYQTVCDMIGEELILGTAVVRSNPAGRSTARGFSVAHEYLIFGAPNENAEIGRLPRNDKQLARYKEKDSIGPFEWVNFRKHGGENANRFARPKLFYPIYVSENGVRIPSLEWEEEAKQWNAIDGVLDDEVVVLPINGDGEEKTWKWGHETAKEKINDLMAKPDQTGGMGIYSKSRMNMDGALPLTLWDKKEYSATEYGTNYLSKIIGDSNLFSFPKSIHAVEDSLRVMKLGLNDTVIDFFAGSGTTAHAVANLNRLDEGKRKFIVCEMGAYFDVVTKPRVLKSHYSEKWKNGKPVDRNGVSSIQKYIRLESYEDATNNLNLSRTEQQNELLNKHKNFREDYMLHYMLDVESRGSLLDLDRFVDPFNVTMKVTRDDETRNVRVDMVETFNYLLGLRVKTMRRSKGIYEVTGTMPDGDNTLIIWRNTNECDNDALDEWFQKQQYNTRDMEFDLIFVNGDNNLENLRRADETWKVRLTEETFLTLMFDVEDV
ncbi:DNA methyltransferase [Terasakiella sp. A23]|uniref:site-specific DNA-methyltransferase n=1 Tax=Terasakiella sp. FCG-A23 TaxID=3080561 RepID=UPI002953F6FB|nr:DNA methyltransferase [Terasakiella sp. A23]MDV7341580.1 DNA methyltransferase [Terasakiella sp. A23]